MKLRILAIFLLAACLNSCSPKVLAMQPSDPAVPQMPAPPKGENAERIAQGKSLYEERCANCHKLFSPSDFSQAEWAPILMRMQPKARYDNAQMALVAEYVNSIAAP